jgi:hypothetical protein
MNSNLLITVKAATRVPCFPFVCAQSFRNTDQIFIDRIKRWPEPYIYDVCTVFLAGKFQTYYHIRCIYNSGRPNLIIPDCDYVVGYTQASPVL